MPFLFPSPQEAGTDHGMSLPEGQRPEQGTVHQGRGSLEVCREEGTREAGIAQDAAVVVCHMKIL